MLVRVFFKDERDEETNETTGSREQGGLCGCGVGVKRIVTHSNATFILSVACVEIKAGMTKK